MRVLITGGGGFIGKKLAARLLKADGLLGRKIEQVTLFDVMPAEGVGPDPRLVIKAFGRFWGLYHGSGAVSVADPPALGRSFALPSRDTARN